jgi:hypothetical protein|tara:strand:+ start:1767 stop:2138 length:372 start_codon:yes stop_codon:yes gene_type:complete
LNPDDGWKRLAQAVVLKAIKDHSIYHAPASYEVRAAWECINRGPNGKATRGEMQKNGLAKHLPSHIKKIISIREDPADFLQSDSEWHIYAEIDPEKFTSLDSPKWRDMAYNFCTYETNKMDIT